MNKYSKVLKIAVGSTVAILIAIALGLDFAVSAGVITLLTLQDTKKETLIVSLKRIAAFILAILIAFIAFTLFSYKPVSYGIFLLLFVGVCYYMEMYDAIPINAVLATHYLLEENMSLGLITNEALLLLIGVSIGIFMNLYIPSNVKQIRKNQRIIEEDIKILLLRMAEKLRIEDKSDYNDKCFDMLEEHILVGLKQAFTNMKNSFFQETCYYIEYMEMRKQQLKVLREIYEKIVTLTTVPLQAHEVADFIKKISDTLSESQNAKELIVMEEELLTKLKESPLPLNRAEFENRAVLYIILMDFRIFLKMKESFSDSLTKEQKDKYWKNENTI
jgi:uncharacterized membrane protein YgaE (UPF0421/DUF939 family)